MPFTSMSDPAQGDATKRTFATTVIDNLDYLYAELSKIKSNQIVNGSFEVPTSGTPDGWTETESGVTLAIDTTDNAHGDQCLKFIVPGDSSSSSGYLETTDYFEVSPNAPFLLSFEVKSSAAESWRKTVSLRWFDSTLSLISTSDIYDSTTNSTSWIAAGYLGTPPSTARFAKLRITVNNALENVSGSVKFDNFRMAEKAFQKSISFEAAGTHVFTAPLTGVARVICIGAGGGGGYGNTWGGGGGGAGGYAEKLVAITSAATYAVVVGAGGAVNVSNDGSAGANSTFETTTVIGNGGSGGVQGGGGAGGAGGAGGSGTGDIVINGLDGSTGAATLGGTGGHCQVGGAGGLSASTGGATGTSPGGGGAGGYDTSGTRTAGTGAPGRVIIQY
jgi:hypothetical protein